MSVINRITARLSESAHVDLAVKTLKETGLVPDGVDAAHIAKGIAKRHGVPMALVPQTVHYAGAHENDNVAYQRHALARGSSHMSADGLAKHEKWKNDYLHAYAAVGAGRLSPHGDAPMAHPLDSDSSAQLPSLIEAAADHARVWHELGTHPQKKLILAHALNKHIGVYGAPPAEDHEVHAAVKAKLDAAQSFDHPHLQSAKTNILQAATTHDYVLKRAAAYNPMRKETWSPSYTGGVSTRAYTAADHQNMQRHANTRALGLINTAAEILADRRGLNIPHAPDAVHTHEGVTYHGYTLDTPEKADAGCWGQRFCISTGDAASSMNAHYHGGVYKPAHIITKLTQEGGKKKETLHAAYLPELLPGGAHEDPEQAVRNSGNNGAVTGEAFKKIHPLLSKLDPRIDVHDGTTGGTPAQHYTRPSSAHESGGEYARA